MEPLRAALAHYIRVRLELGEQRIDLPYGLRARVTAKRFPSERPALSLLPTRAGGPSLEPVMEATPVTPVRAVARCLSREEKVRELAALQERATGCMKCPHLARFRSTVVFGEGDPDAMIMFVGEAPGADEDEAGRPFVGAAGQLLTKMVGAMGLERGQVYIANVLKCRPDMPSKSMPGNRKPTGSEMATCLPYLASQIEVIQPRVIVALGATAVEGLLAKPKVVMAAVRHVWHDFQGIPVMPTYHPAYLLRNQAMSEKRKVWEDLLAVMERVGLPISDKQRGFFRQGDR